MTEKPAPAERADPSPKVAEALGQLRSLLAEAHQLAEVLQSRVGKRPPVVPPDAGAALRAAAEAAGGGDPGKVEVLTHELDEARRDQEEISAQLVEAENLAGKLMSLYVATYQLHVSLDPVEVQNAIAEIARDLLGASSFALLIKDDVEGGCEVALAQGVDPGSRFAGPRYDGGDPMVDATLSDGVLRLEGPGVGGVLAAVPLREVSLTWSSCLRVRRNWTRPLI